MSLKVTYPDEFAFIGNPMLIDIESDTTEEIIISIGVNKVDLIDLSVFPFGDAGVYRAKVDVSKFLASFFERYTTKQAIIDILDGFALDYSLSVSPKSTEPGTIIKIFNGKAFFGGISKFNYQFLKSKGTDIFEYRFRNPERQFLFTTRTNSNYLVLRETELYPFVFIHPEGEISITSPNGKRMTFESRAKDTVCSFDVDLLRRAYFEECHELVSFFAVMVDKKNVFNIAIVPNTISEESYLLKFRNSVGAYELIEVTGNGYDVQKFSEEDVWEASNSVEIYEEHRSRVASRKTMTVETGYKTQEELSFITDLIRSDDVYLIDTSDPLKREYRCLITPEELTIPKRITTPLSVKLDLRMVMEEMYQSPDIVYDKSLPLFQNLTIPGNPRINRYGLIYIDDYPFYSM